MTLCQMVLRLVEIGKFKFYHLETADARAESRVTEVWIEGKQTKNSLV